MRRSFHHFWIAAFTLIAVSVFAPVAQSRGVHATVVNGNTLIIGTKRIYLRGVDAPETDQLCLVKRVQWACGKQAARELARKIGGKPINCKIRGNDDADCWGGGVNLGSWMVSNGWAAASGPTSIYAGEERTAKRAKRGIWQSEFVRPWSWRRGLRAGTSATNSEARDCPIKGDITASGERIYIVPKHRQYSRVQIDTGKNERWFCSVAQAVRAGWSAPTR
jgi:endonuclease YncB( thermonuclease family)